jgi:translation initiation factor IF-2
MAKKTTAAATAIATRPPIVAVLGHVDHGKTSLLDYIRKTNVAAREHGGITQHIGAYQVEYATKKGATAYPITFIDTPGHEAFAKMRSRGAHIADIAILVVAADDSVKPQTIESIKMIKDAGIPMIVAANKIDLPGANLDKMRQDLARYGVQVEGFGGDVPLVPISAKAGTGIPDLLEMIVLVAADRGFENKPTAPLSANVVETRVDRGKGMVATVIVREGTLSFGTRLYDGDKEVGKVRAMFDEYGKTVPSALPGKPAEVLGFTILPVVGSIVTAAPVAPAVVAPESAKLKAFTLADILKPIEKTNRLALIIKADTAGSLEAIVGELGDQVDITATGVGEITEGDILLAKSTASFVVGFNVRAPASIEKLAQLEKVVYRTYTIIYELLDEMHDVVEGMAEITTGERELGKGAIVAEFPFDGQRIAGTKVLSGRIARGDMVRIMREENEIGRAKIKSVRRGKDDVTKVDAGNDCGLLFDKNVAFEAGDGIIAVTTV